MQSQKCPVCDWAIENGGVKVKVGDRQITVCCAECATKAKAAAKQKRASR